MFPVLLLLLASSGVAVKAAPPTARESTAAVDPVFVAYAAELERGLNAGDGDVLDARLDMEELLQRAIRGVEAPPAFFEGMRSGLGREGPLQPGRQVVGELEPGSGVKLLRTRVLQGAPRALLRLQFKEERGFNYWDVELRRAADGTVRVVDLYIYAAGERLSETLHRMVLMGLADARLGVVDRLLGKEALFLKSVPDMKRMKAATTAGRYEEALAIYAKLPPSIQAERVFLLLRLHAASGLGAEEARYAEAIAAFEKAFPGDPALDLVALDGYALRKDYAGAMRALDRLDRRVRDPFLHVLRGNFAVEQQDVKAARAHYLAALEGEPGLVTAHAQLIWLALTARDFGEVSARLTAAERDTDLVFDGVEGAESFAEYAKSPEFRAWRRARARAKQPAP